LQRVSHIDCHLYKQILAITLYEANLAERKYTSIVVGCWDEKVEAALKALY
jgi:hypothetical protein